MSEYNLFAPDIGDNQPPEPILDDSVRLDLINPEALVDPTILVPLFEHHYVDLISLVAERRAGIDRWMLAHTTVLPDGSRSPPRIQDDADLQNVIEFRKQLMTVIKKDGMIDLVRAAVKRPMIDANAIAEEWFAKLAEPIVQGHAAIHRAYEAHLIEQAAEAERKRQEAIKQAQEDAKALAERARQAKSAYMQDQLAGDAADAERQAEELRRKADVPVIESSRVRGTFGSIGGLKELWHFKVDDLMTLLKAVVDGKESIDLVLPNERLIKTLLGKPSYRRTIPGLTIYSEKKGR